MRSFLAIVVWMFAGAALVFAGYAWRSYAPVYLPWDTPLSASYSGNAEEDMIFESDGGALSPAGRAEGAAQRADGDAAHDPDQQIRAMLNQGGT